jgi:hypothetical protein
LAFDAGVPTSYTQTTGSELAGLLTLPADVIGAYAGAVGNLFSAFKSSADNEMAYRRDILQLELQKQKQAECLDAIRNNRQSEIDQLGCKSL